MALHGVLNAESEFQEAAIKSVPPFGNLDRDELRSYHRLLLMVDLYASTSQ